MTYEDRRERSFESNGPVGDRVTDTEDRLRKSILYNPDPEDREAQLGLLGDLGDARAALEAEVAELHSRLQAATDGSEAPADQAAPLTTQFFSEELQSVLSAAQESATRIVERATAEAERSMTDARASVEVELAEVRAAAERELAEARSQHERTLAEDRLAVEQELATARADHEQQMSTARTDLDQDMAAARAAQEQEMIKARTALEQEVSAARARTEEELGRVRDEALQDAARVRAGVEEEAQAALFAAREEAERIRNDAAAAAEQERSAVEAERRRAREELDRDLEASRADLEAMHAQAVKFEGWRTRMTGVLGELGPATEGQRARIDEVPDRIREALAPAIEPPRRAGRCPGSGVRVARIVEPRRLPGGASERAGPRPVRAVRRGHRAHGRDGGRRRHRHGIHGRRLRPARFRLRRPALRGGPRCVGRRGRQSREPCPRGAGDLRRGAGIPH